MEPAKLVLAGLLAAALVVQLYTSAGLNRRLNTAERGTRKTPGFAYVILSLPMLLMCAVNLPLPLFYLISYGACVVPALLLQGGRVWEGLMVNMRFMLFATPHLVILSLLALLSRCGVREVLLSFELRTLSLVLTLALNAALNLALLNRLKPRIFRLIGWDSEEFLLFSRFVWFCSISALLDSVTCLFDLPAQMAVLFLLGSNLLVLLLVVLFALHVYQIARDATIEEEYLRLQEEAAAQREQTARLEKEAYLDKLTGAYTRRYALDNIAAMLQNDEGFALAFLDLDGLKQINDRQGHLAGDRYLQRFAACVKAELHPSDVFARYGGDEFLVLMPGGAQREAAQRLARLQARAAGGAGQNEATPFSYGLVLAKKDAALTAEEWVAAADKAMYADKKLHQAHREGC